MRLIKITCVYYLLALSFLCNAQDASINRINNIALGGSFWGQVRKSDWNDVKVILTTVDTDILLGYFISNNDLLYVKPGIYFEKSKHRNIPNYDQDLNLKACIAYRRYLSNGFFFGPFVGTEIEIWSYSTSWDFVQDKDRSYNGGIEIGYSHNLSNRVLLELRAYYSYNRTTYQRDETETFYYSRVGPAIGLIYLFNESYNNRKHE